MNMKRASDDYWGLLSDECKKSTIDPISAIKGMVDQALTDGAITSNIYPIIEQRVPFPGFEKRDRKDIGKDYGVTGERIRQIEHRTYSILKNIYLQRD